MKVLQVLPNLESGGVERGTVDFAGELVRRGHQSLVMSMGGRLVEQLEAEGSTHVRFPVHEKSLKSLWRVRALRRLLLELDVDVIHVRSRVPAWMVWLALKKIPVNKRPALVSTFHGLYSVSPYSAIMGCGDRVIAISYCVRDYITSNYPKIDPQKITVVHRGVDTRQFNREFKLDQQWLDSFHAEYPQLKGKPLIMMPGRLSRWKGQEQFIELIAALKAEGSDCHGIIVGDPTPGKDAYLQELKDKVASSRLKNDITFLGHRSDMTNMYAISSVVCNLSQHPEPFGRTVIEAMAMGVPVVAFDCGGPAESLRDCLPQGLVPQNDMSTLKAAVTELLQDSPEFKLPEAFTLNALASNTLGVYEKALSLSYSSTSSNSSKNS
ncbi:MAG: glycosyltransferase family 4 protein [Amphritea sp.]